MICPKGKHSRARRDKRRAQTWKIPLANVAKCAQCGELARSHRVCKSCGYYGRREVMAV